MNKHAEYILYILVAAAILLIASLCRLVIVKAVAIEQFDENVILVVCILLILAILWGFCMIFEKFFSCIFKSLERLFFPKKKVTNATLTTNTSPTTVFGTSNFNHIRQNSIIEQKQLLQKRVDKAIEYTQRIFPAYTDDNNILQLSEYISRWAISDEIKADQTIRVSSALKSIDLYHYGWNVGKLLNKRNDAIARFLKEIFKEHLADISTTTVERKLRCNDPCTIKLENDFKNQQ